MKKHQITLIILVAILFIQWNIVSQIMDWMLVQHIKGALSDYLAVKNYESPNGYLPKGFYRTTFKTVFIFLLGGWFIRLTFKKVINKKSFPEIYRNFSLIVIILIAFLHFGISIAIVDYYNFKTIKNIKSENFTIKKIVSKEFKKYSKGNCSGRLEIILDIPDKEKILHFKCDLIGIKKLHDNLKVGQNIKLKTGKDTYGNSLVLEIEKI